MLTLNFRQKYIGNYLLQMLLILPMLKLGMIYGRIYVPIRRQLPVK